MNEERKIYLNEWIDWEQHIHTDEEHAKATNLNFFRSQDRCGQHRSTGEVRAARSIGRLYLQRGRKRRDAL